MGKRETRIEITDELHSLLHEKLEELRSKEVKGITLKKLVEQLCRAGLEYQALDKNKKTEIKQTDSLGVHHPASTGPREYLTESKSDLKIMQEALRIKEDRLLAREKHLDNREQMINQKYHLTLEEKDNNINLKAHAEEMVKDNAINKSTIKHQKRPFKSWKRN